MDAMFPPLGNNINRGKNITNDEFAADNEIHTDSLNKKSLHDEIS